MIIRVRALCLLSLELTVMVVDEEQGPCFETHYRLHT